MKDLIRLNYNNIFPEITKKFLEFFLENELWRINEDDLYLEIKKYSISNPDIHADLKIYKLNLFEFPTSFSENEKNYFLFKLIKTTAVIAEWIIERDEIVYPDPIIIQRQVNPSLEVYKRISNNNIPVFNNLKSSA